VSSSSTFFACFFVRKSFLAAFSSYVLALAPKFCTKNTRVNVDEIDGRWHGVALHFWMWQLLSISFSSHRNFSLDKLRTLFSLQEFEWKLFKSLRNRRSLKSCYKFLSTINLISSNFTVINATNPSYVTVIILINHYEILFVHASN